MKGHNDILQWWCTKCLPVEQQPSDTRQSILRDAAYYDHMHVLNGGFFSAEESLQMIERIDPCLVCRHLEIVLWIHNHNQDAKLEILLDHAIGQDDVKFVA